MKKSGTHSAIERLQRALEQVSFAAQFELLSPLRVTQLLSKRGRLSGELSQRSLGELVDMGAWQIARVKGMGPSRIADLAELLEGFVQEHGRTAQGDDDGAAPSLPEDPSLQPDPSFDGEEVQGGEVHRGDKSNHGAISPTQPVEVTGSSGSDLTASENGSSSLVPESKSGRDPLLLDRHRATASREIRPPLEIPVLGSVEAHEKLLQGFRELQENPRFPQIKHRLVEEFWDDLWPRAPFVECLTLSQLVNMKVESLLEKRSFGVRKAPLLLMAIDRALNDHTRKTTGSTEPIELSRLRQGRPLIPTSDASTAVVASVTWLPSQTEIPLHLQSHVREFENLISERESTALVRQLLRYYPRALTRLEFVVLSLAEEYDSKAAALMLRLSEEDYYQRMQQALRRIRTVTQNEAPGLAALLGLVSKHLLIPEALLDELFFDNTLPAATRHLARTSVMKAFGCHRLCVDQVDLRDRLGVLWTGDQARVTTVLTVLQTAHNTESVRLEAWEAVFPLLPATLLQSLLEATPRTDVI